MRRLDFRGPAQVSGLAGACIWCEFPASQARQKVFRHVARRQIALLTELAGVDHCGLI